MSRSRAWVACILLTGCVAATDQDEVDLESPSEPQSFTERMFDQAALESYSPEDRAYVQGHALAVYLYGKTLPRYTGSKGYSYRPGVSAPHADVAYDWERVMIARSGGTDGNGGDAGATDGEDPAVCDGEDDVCPEPVPGDEDPGDGDDEQPDDDGDPWIDDDCETFLDPAAMDARALVADLPSLAELSDGQATGARLERRFRDGIREALHLEDLDEDTDSSEVEHLKQDVQDYGMCDHSPLVLDLDGDGIEISSVSDGVEFDLLGRGPPVRTAWPRPGDALLAIDVDGDGRVTSGAELFGNGNGFASGFHALARLDRAENGGNGDRAIDAADSAFSSLVVWRDDDRDGSSQPAEMSTLEAAGVVRIDLDFSVHAERDAAGNRHLQRSTFTTAGRATVARPIVDVWFRYRRVQ